MPVYKAFVYTTPDQIHYSIKVCDRTHGTLAECVLNYNITEFERIIYIVHTLLNQLHVLGFSHGTFSWDHVYFTNQAGKTSVSSRHYTSLTTNYPPDYTTTWKVRHLASRTGRSRPRLAGPEVTVVLTY